VAMATALSMRNRRVYNIETRNKILAFFASAPEQIRISG
jgi:hypothetical protein